MRPDNIEKSEMALDWTISQRGGGGTLRSPKLDVQLKCTEVASIGERSIKYSLPIKNYEELRPDNVQVPRILVVVTVPRNVEDWLLLNDDVLALKNSAYWVSLRGHTRTENVETITVELPRSRRFDPPSLSQIMERIGSGDLP